MDAPLALAFTAGMVAVVNPCGFAMLPAYLSYFLGLESVTPDGSDTEPRADLSRALAVAGAVSAGFLALFAVAGAVVSWTSLRLVDASPWLTIAIGLAVAVGGVAFLFGWDPSVALPRLDRGGRTRGMASMFVFGLSYAIASLSCTLAPFTGVVATTFGRESFASGLATFVAYGLGMALLLIILTVTLAMARQGMVRGLRRALPYVHRVSGSIMALMGVYLIWYGIYEIRLIGRGEKVAGGPVSTVTNWSATLSDRLYDVDPFQAVLVLGLVVSTAVLIGLLRSDQR
ncbi:MAG: cytochrome c biogenesis protein CcdA [Microthrixaceae bacterium]|jgi:cytochrome c-type biogenesis protein|nr:cytochrome c biogenesis protein CcdA [Microthrixaceae bacterium]